MNERQQGFSDFVATGERTERSEEERPASTGGAQMVKEQPPAALFAGDEAERLRTRWTEIQATFVDEPRAAVQQADGLVAEAMKRLAEIFSEERGKLEHQWDRGDDVSTEDLRVALQRYRSFFNRLLSV